MLQTKALCLRLCCGYTFYHFHYAKIRLFLIFSNGKSQNKKLIIKSLYNLESLYESEKLVELADLYQLYELVHFTIKNEESVGLLILRNKGMMRSF